MQHELDLRLLATPTLQIPNIGPGDLARLGMGHRAVVTTLLSMAQRREWTAQGVARADGAFPCPNVSYFRTSLAAYRFASDKQAAKRWLIKRAQALGCTDLLPESWGRVIAVAGPAQTDGDGVMLAVYPPLDVADQLAGNAEGDHRPDDMHVTLLYFGDITEVNLDAVTALQASLPAVLAERLPLVAHVTEAGMFEAEDGENPQIYHVDCTGLDEIRDVLLAASRDVGLIPHMNFDFTPHMTVRYGGEPLSGVPEGGDREWPVNEVTLSIGTEYTVYQIGKSREFAAIKGPYPYKKHPHEPEGPKGGQWARTPNNKWKPKKKPKGTSKMATTASVNLGWSEEFQFFWNPTTDETFRVSSDGVVEVFDIAVPDFDDVTNARSDWAESAVEAKDVVKLPLINTLETLEAITNANAADDTTGADVLPSGAGREFRIPVVIPEGVPSGDGRTFAQGAVEFKDPPIPLLWQKATGQGHDGAVTVGKITSIERIDAGLGNAMGVFDTHEDAIEAARQVREKFLTGVSGDVDQFEAEVTELGDGQEALDIRHGRLVAATLVAKPAFQEATIEFITHDDEEEVIVASAGPLHPPRGWFANPGLSAPTRLTVESDGRVFGHIAAWGTPHLGNNRIQPPHSTTGYKFFNGKPLRTADGTDIKVGQLTLVGGHAALNLPADRAMAHYDNTRSAVADVVAGEDEHGIWVAGALRPDVTEEQVRAFRASDPSGDWRAIDGELELVAVCQVNVPGFPVARAMVATGGVRMSLVAAGAIFKRTQREPNTALIAALDQRLSALEAIETARRTEAALSKLKALRG
jgi:2'-5' RNA ligase